MYSSLSFCLCAASTPPETAPCFVSFFFISLCAAPTPPETAPYRTPGRRSHLIPQLANIIGYTVASARTVNQHKRPHPHWRCTNSVMMGVGTGTCTTAMVPLPIAQPPWYHCRIFYRCNEVVPGDGATQKGIVEGEGGLAGAGIGKDVAGAESEVVEGAGGLAGAGIGKDIAGGESGVVEGAAGLAGAGIATGGGAGGLVGAQRRTGFRGRRARQRAGCS